MDFEPVITAVIETCEDVADIDSGRYPGQSADVTPESIGRPQFSAHIASTEDLPSMLDMSGTRIVRARLVLETTYGAELGDRVDDELRRATLARAPTVAEAIRNALMTAASLATTDAGTSTGVVSGCCVSQSSSAMTVSDPENGFFRWRQELDLLVTGTRSTTA